MTKNEVKNLLSNSKEDEYEAKDNEKDFECYLYGTKYYCTSNVANKIEIVFDFCEKMEKNEKQMGATGVTLSRDNTVNNNNHQDNEDDLKVTTTKATMANRRKSAIVGKQRKQQQRLEQARKLAILQNMEHESGFKSINFEKQDRGHSDGNCFYLDSQSDSQQRQLRHCFLRIYEKNNQQSKNINKKNKENKKVKKIKLIQDLEHMRWHGQNISRAMNPKLYKSIPLFIILCQFLFDECKNNFNHMSLMEAIDCLLVFKNYHKNDNFQKCNQVLSKKLATIASDSHAFFPKWSQVGYFCASCILRF